jgi:predicted AlkP superfamily phosphohydrolase/phosphomutase
VFAEAILVNEEYWDGALSYAAEQPWQLLVAYNPTLDSVQHAWFGLVDPESSAYRPELADRIRPYVEQLFTRCADQYIGLLRKRFPDAALVVTSDHGVEGVGRTLYPNTILSQAGLLTLAADGTIDLSRTKAVYLWGRGGIITINSTAWKSGIVPDEQRSAVARAVTHALLAARDPETGAPVVQAVFDAGRDGEALGFGGPGVDLVFDPAPDYAPSAGFGPTVIADSSGRFGRGQHGASPFRRKLHAIFYAAGPGVGRGIRLPIVRSIDVAPTVSALLGIPAPANSEGQALILNPVRRN